MSINLVELVNGYLGKDAINQMSGLIGEGADKTQAALATALPTVIGGFIGKASSTSGAEELLQSIDQLDANILDDVRGRLGGPQASSLLSQGSDLLKMLFGGKLNSVLDLMSRSTGLGGKSMSSLLAALAPIVMGVLKKQRSTAGLDLNGVIKLLMEQKDLLRGKLPGGFGDLLGMPELASVSNAAAQRTSPAVTTSIRDGAHSISDSGGTIMGRVLPVIALLALALIAWQLFSKRPDAKTEIDSPITGPLNDESMISPDVKDIKLQGPARDESLDGSGKTNTAPSADQDEGMESETS